MILKVPGEFYFKRIPLLRDLILTSQFCHCTAWHHNRRSVTTWLPLCILLEYQLTQSFYFGPLLLLIGRSCFACYQNTRRACRKLFPERMIRNIKTVFIYMRLLYWTGWVMQAGELLQILPILKAVQAHQGCWTVILLRKCSEKYSEPVSQDYLWMPHQLNFLPWLCWIKCLFSYRQMHLPLFISCWVPNNSKSAYFGRHEFKHLNLKYNIL